MEATAIVSAKSSTLKDVTFAEGSYSRVRLKDNATMSEYLDITREIKRRRNSLGLATILVATIEHLLNLPDLDYYNRFEAEERELESLKAGESKRMLLLTAEARRRYILDKPSDTECKVSNSSLFADRKVAVLELGGETFYVGKYGGYLAVAGMLKNLTKLFADKDLEIEITGEVDADEDEQQGASGNSDTQNLSDSFTSGMRRLIMNGVHQLILTGAPGTGKTYTAQQIALSFISGAEKKRDENPDSPPDEIKLQEKGNRLYQWYSATADSEAEDGGGAADDLRKRIKPVVAKILRDQNCYGKGQLQEIYLARENDPASGKFQAKDVAALVKHIDKRPSETAEPGEGPYSTEAFWQDVDDMRGRISLVQFHPSYDYTDFVDGLRPVEVEDDNGGKSMVFRRVDGSFVRFCRYVQWKNSQAPKGEALPRYFFIIDEINRADLSKVLGELMFGLESDKRGSIIKTQYHNLKTYFDVSPEETELAETGEYYHCFDAGIKIPPNIVVIGTMNDIDRSVESMDFAMRRRFVWEEVEVTEKLLLEAFENGAFFSRLAGDDEEVLAQVNELVAGGISFFNKTALRANGFGSGYDIAHGQFTGIREDALRALDESGGGKISEYDATDAKSVADHIMEWVWRYRVKPLLREYLRAKPEVDVDQLAKDWKARPLPKKNAETRAADASAAEQDAPEAST